MEIKEQYYTNSFLASLLNSPSTVDTLAMNIHWPGVWSGGIRSYVAGQNFDIWHKSGDKILANKFLNQNEPYDTFQNNDTGSSFGIILRKNITEG